MTYRVVQWSVGGRGPPGAAGPPAAARTSTVVGVFTHTADRGSGRDAGDLRRARCRDRRAVDRLDAGALLELGPDCVVFTSVGETRPRQAVAELVQILGSGADVVSSSMMNLIYPPAARPQRGRGPSRACAQGGSTLFTSGLDPGFSGDALPLAALQICERVDTIRVQELSDYGAHPDSAWAVAVRVRATRGCTGPASRARSADPVLGRHGRDAVADSSTSSSTASRSSASGGTRPTPSTCRSGPSTKDTLAAVRFGVAGIVGGERRLFAEHVTRMRHDMAPHWPRPPAGRTSVHRVEIEGRPSLTLDLCLGPSGAAQSGPRTAGHGHAARERHPRRRRRPARHRHRPRSQARTGRISSSTDCSGPGLITRQDRASHRRPWRLGSFAELAMGGQFAPMASE